MRSAASFGRGKKGKHLYDFEKHRQEAAANYSVIRETNVRFAAELESLLTRVLNAKRIAFHQVTARAKTVDKFADKAVKPEEEHPERPKYANPMVDITDMTGVRVIVLNRSALKDVDDTVRTLFKERERTDKGDRNLERGTVGYESIHYLVQFNSDRSDLLENREFANLTAEIQIRTILQHAWAEIEHDIRYKTSSDPHKVISQRFAALAGLVNIGDREFDEIYRLDKERRQGVRGSAQISEDEIPEKETISKKESREVIAASISALTTTDAPSFTQMSPRTLIANRQYPEAILAYNRLIASEPTQFAHFIGRARARFLNGDATGALSDLARSDEISPKNPLSATVRALITGETTSQSFLIAQTSEQVPFVGDDGRSVANTYDAQADGQERSDESFVDPFALVAEGHSALERGDHAVALKNYLAAEKVGFNPVYSVFNRAMARCLEQRFTLCLRTLERLHPFPGSMLEFHVKMLQGICILAEGGQVTDVLPTIAGNRRALSETVGYDYSRSVLKHLELGLSSTHQEVWSKVKGVFLSARNYH